MVELVERITAFGWPVIEANMAARVASLGWTKDGNAYMSGDGFNEPHSSCLVQAGYLRSLRCPLTDSCPVGSEPGMAEIANLFDAYVEKASQVWGAPASLGDMPQRTELWFLDNGCSLELSNWGRGVSLQYSDPDLSALRRKKG